MVVAILVAIVAAGVVAVVAGGGPDAASSPASSLPSPTESGRASASPTDAETPDALPDSIDGSDRLTGSIADAYEDLMRSVEGGDLAIAYGVYGTETRPRFVMAHLTESLPLDEFPGESLLELISETGQLELTGQVHTGEEGGVAAACSAVEVPGVSFLCLLNSETGYFMLMGLEPASGDEMLTFAYEAGS